MNQETNIARRKYTPEGVLVWVEGGRKEGKEEEREKERERERDQPNILHPVQLHVQQIYQNSVFAIHNIPRQ